MHKSEHKAFIFLLTKLWNFSHHAIPTQMQLSPLPVPELPSSFRRFVSLQNSWPASPAFSIGVRSWSSPNHLAARPHYEELPAASPPRLGDGETLNSAPGFLLSIYSCAGFGAVPTNGKTSERADLFKSSQHWEVSFWEMRWGLLKLRQGYIHVLQITCYIRRGIYITEMWPFFSFEERR